MLQKNEPILMPPAPDRPAGPVIENQSGKECIIPSAREFILKAGIQAPSADNCQPWLFSWKGCDLLIESDLDRTHFFYDINQESTLITFGALIENMSLAAGELGLATIPGPVLLSKDGEVSICISFKGGGSQPDILAPFIRHRCINRKPYSSKLIEADLIEAMNSNFQGSSGVRVHWIENQKEKKIFQEIVYLSDRVLFEEKRLHEGLFKFIHMGDELFPKDGMNLGVLELSWIQKKIFPFFSKWKYQSLMNKIMVSRAMAFNSVSLLKKTPVYVVLTIDQRHPEMYVRAGRSMERFWIHANSIGLAVQPMAGFVFLMNHYNHNQAKHFQSSHQKMIRRIKEQFDGIIEGPGKDCPAPVMFFRVGYAAPQKNRTGRRPLSEVMKVL